MSDKNDYNTAFLLHLSAFFGFVFPFGGVIIPLIIWETNKRKNDFLEKNGKEAINFNLSYLLYSFVIAISIIPFVINSILSELNHMNLFVIVSMASLIGILAIIKFILIIQAAIKANQGEVYQYPLTIKFIK